MRIFAIVLLLSMTSAHSQSLYLNYGQWEQMPIGFREIYLAGVFDTLSIVTEPAPAGMFAARYYNECVARTGLSSGQLEENVRGYGQTHTDLQSKPVPVALVGYLISLCGRAIDAMRE